MSFDDFGSWVISWFGCTMSVGRTENTKDTHAHARTKKFTRWSARTSGNEQTFTWWWTDKLASQHFDCTQLDRIENLAKIIESVGLSGRWMCWVGHFLLLLLLLLLLSCSTEAARKIGHQKKCASPIHVWELHNRITATVATTSTTVSVRVSVCACVRACVCHQWWKNCWADAQRIFRVKLTTVYVNEIVRTHTRTHTHTRKDKIRPRNELRRRSCATEKTNSAALVLIEKAKVQITRKGWVLAM